VIKVCTLSQIEKSPAELLIILRVQKFAKLEKNVAIANALQLNKGRPTPRQSFSALISTSMPLASALITTYLV